jgi:hypothetical protein
VLEQRGRESRFDRLVSFHRKCLYERLAAGHFIEKIGGAATYFDLRNIRAQCNFACNRRLHGNKAIFAEKLVREYGPEVLTELRKKAQTSKHWTWTAENGRLPIELRGNRGRGQLQLGGAED